jgi:hypothetical protein
MKYRVLVKDTALFPLVDIGAAVGASDQAQAAVMFFGECICEALGEVYTGISSVGTHGPKQGLPSAVSEGSDMLIDNRLHICEKASACHIGLTNQ